MYFSTVIWLHKMTFFFSLCLEKVPCFRKRLSQPQPLLPSLRVSAKTDTHCKVRVTRQKYIYIYIKGCVCVWKRGSVCEGGEGGRQRGEFYLSLSAAPQKNRIVSSILGIKAKPAVIVATILTEADNTVK